MLGNSPTLLPNACPDHLGMAYATPADFLFAYDARRVAELLSDTDNPVTPDDIANNETLLRLLEDASAEVRLACRVGERYTADHLAALAVDPTHKYSLIRLVNDICYAFLVSRRGYSSKELQDLAPNWERAQQMLEWLRLGERVFDASGAPEAGAAVDVITPLQSTRCTIVSKASRLFGPISVGGNDRYNCPPSGGGCCGH